VVDDDAAASAEVRKSVYAADDDGREQPAQAAASNARCAAAEVGDEVPVTSCKAKQKKPADPKPETLTNHWARAPIGERTALLDELGVGGVLEAGSPKFNADLQRRCGQPANPLLRLREMDDVTAAETLIEAFGAGRFEKIAEKVRELRAPKGGGKPASHSRGASI
jgi:hypothetical protein